MKYVVLQHNSLFGWWVGKVEGRQSIPSSYLWSDGVWRTSVDSNNNGHGYFNTRRFAIQIMKKMPDLKGRKIVTYDKWLEITNNNYV